MPPAIVYTRFSPRPNGESCESNETQLDRCRAYCTGLGYDVAGWYEDRELSGARADNRPGLQSALAHVCRVRGVLVVYSLSRLARNTRDAIDLVARLQDAGADLAVLQEHVNTRSSMGNFIFTVFAALAQLEREQVSERTSDAMLRHQASGRRMTRLDRCPYGWMPDPDSAAVARLDDRSGLPSGKPAGLIECEGEQRAIARMRELRAEGLGLRKIAERLTAEGLKPRGQRWHEATIASLLRREVR